MQLGKQLHWLIISSLNKLHQVLPQVLLKPRHPLMDSEKRMRGEEPGASETSSCEEGRKQIQRKYNVDHDTLDCPICMKPFSPPVYQCKNGHTACSACCKKLRKGCPSCSQPIGSIRCIAVEKIVESVQVSCKNAVHGYGEMIKYPERKEHEKNLCKYNPFHFPVSGCTYVGQRFSVCFHLSEEHQVRSVKLDRLHKQVFKMKASDLYMVIEGAGRNFVLHHKKTTLGDMFFCTSFGAYNNLHILTVKHENSSMFCGIKSMVCDIRREADWKRDVVVNFPQQRSGCGNFEIEFTLQHLQHHLH